MKNKFWLNKRVLITGFEGFLGSHLTKTLLATKAKVVGLDIKTYRKETILCQADYKRMKVIKGSVVNYKLLQEILSNHSINVIFHLAAEAIVSTSQQKPRMAFETNIAGTWEVLEAARQYGKIKALIVASSDKAYGSHKKLPYSEDMPLIANHPYDVSKSCADLIAQTYVHTYALPLAITRCGNIFGPGDFNFSRLIPDAIRCSLTDKTLFIRSDGKFVRDYIYIDDIVRGYLLLAEKLPNSKKVGGAFNFSDENPLTVLDVAKEISRISGKKLQYKILNNAKYEIRQQCLKSQKSKSILNWHPSHTFAEGINKTIEWFKSSLIIS